MRLSPSAFERLFTALADAFSEPGDFGVLARGALGRNLSDIAPANARNPEIVQALITYAETTDAVVPLVELARKLNATNVSLQAIDPGLLEPAVSTQGVIDAASGAGDFKPRLQEALGELRTSGMEAVAGRDLDRMLQEAGDDDAATLLLALLGTTRAGCEAVVTAAVVPVVARALRRWTVPGTRPADLRLDFARVSLPRIDLSGLDLHEADLAFADLTHAELTDTNLWRSRAYGVTVSKAGLSRSNLEECRWHSAVARDTRFHDCRMVSAFLKEAELAGAQFERSRLQGAHFEGANLTGARFEQANIADAWFRGAVIDDAAAASLARARHWEQAHFDRAAQDAVSAHARA